ncbi:MAG: hypothetical protein ACFCUJ_11470 [Thiotrichales bacterium]
MSNLPADPNAPRLRGHLLRALGLTLMVVTLLVPACRALIINVVR